MNETSTTTRTTTSMNTQWVCKVCSWVYDPIAGAPDHGIAAGTPFEAIPDDWYCPDCGVTKADFECLDF